MNPRSALIPLCLCVAALSGCADDTVVIPVAPAETLAVVFQDGVAPDTDYRGTRDAFLANGPSNDLRNGNFGTVDVDRVGSVDIDGSFYESRFIVKLDLSAVTDCSQVISARLSISGDFASPDSITLAAYRVIRPSYNTWVEGFGGVMNGVSWTTLDGAVSWNTEGGDIDSTPLAEVTVSNDTTATFSLPPLLVRSWMLEPATNQGVIIGSDDLSRESFALVHARETAELSRRPRLEVVYLRGG